MPVIDIPFETIIDLGQRMKAIIPGHLWDRGHVYARENRVIRVFTAHNTVFATVRGSQSYDVQIEVRLFPRAAFCTCPYNEPCKHMAAVFLSLYSAHEPMDKFLTLSSSGTASIEQAESAPYQPEPLDSLEGWHSYLEKAFHRGLPKQALEWPSLFPVYLGNLSRNIDKNISSWPNPRKFLFETYYLVFLIHLAIRLGSSMLNESMRSIVSMIAPPPADLVLTESEIQELQSVAAMMHGWFTQSQGVEYQVVLLYTAIWSTTLQPLLQPDLEQTALHQLRSGEDGKFSPKTQRVLGIAECHLLILANRAATARSLFAAMPSQPLPNEHQLVYNMLDDLAGQALFEPSELHLWLRLVTREWPKDRQSIKKLSQLWLIAGREESAAAECEQMLRLHLVHTADAYNHFLLEREDYETWSQLQLANRLNPKEINKETLKLVEKRAPQVLLPIYHQAAERYVQEKNRGAYTEAVRLLVKLSSLYKKLKRQSDWADFLEAFVARHSRRSALRDLLERRRLIP